MKVYNPNIEERAFLYQEAQALEPLIKDLGSLTVLVEEQPTAKSGAAQRERFRVTFLVAPETVGLRVQATNSDLFAAAIAAKSETQRQLNALINALPTTRQIPAHQAMIPPQLLH